MGRPICVGSAWGVAGEELPGEPLVAPEERQRSLRDVPGRVLLLDKELPVIP